MKGGLRAAIFALGTKGYGSRAELAKAVAQTTRHAAEKVGFQVAVVTNAKHPGNGRKSKEITKGDRRFLVACQAIGRPGEPNHSRQSFWRLRSSVSWLKCPHVLTSDIQRKSRNHS
jgi:hypothetical protein